MRRLPVFLLLFAVAACQRPADDAPAASRAPADAWTVVRVVDGDTVVLVTDAGAEERIRIRGIDTPEVHASNKLDNDAERAGASRDAVRALGRAASDHAERLLPPGTPVVAEPDGRDRYGRLVAYLTVYPDDEPAFDFGGRMVVDGYANAYDGGGRYPHPRMDAYRAHERAAREAERGLWDERTMAQL